MSFQKLRLLTSGESHGPAITAILEGLPSGVRISKEALQQQMRRRQAGYGRGARMQIETDEVEITGGIRFGLTLGSPICLVVQNRDHQNWQRTMPVWEAPSSESRPEVHRPRPGHADLAGGLKYGEHDLRNILERASARETAARTAAGSVCRQLLEAIETKIASHVISIGQVRTDQLEAAWEDILAVQDSERLRCVDRNAEDRMVSEIEEARKRKETLGGVFEVVAHGVLPGLGSHTHWDKKIDGRIAAAILSIPAVKGISIGNAFEIAGLYGSQAHDEIFYGENQFYRKTNRAGGTEGGITNGEEIRVRVAMKPLSTLMKPLQSVDVVTKQPQDAVVERSDVCAVPAAGVVAEAMLALVLADAVLEKFSCDSLAELQSAIQSYKNQLKGY